MTQFQGQTDAAFRREMSEADIELYIARMSVVCEGETKLAAAIESLDQDGVVFIMVEAGVTVTAIYR